MGVHIGSEGEVKVGSDLVAEVTGFTLNTGSTLIDTTKLSDTSDTNKSGNKNWGGSVETHWDETDTLGQGALVEGAEVTLNLFPMGSQTGAKFFSGLAKIESISYPTGINQTVGASFTFKGNGPLSRPTQA